MIKNALKMKRGTKIGWVLVAFSLLLSVWVIISQSVKAETTTSEGIVINDDKDTIIAYSGAGGDLTCSDVPPTVVAIAPNAFAGQVAITSIAIPPGIASIGEGAFSGCEGLTNVGISGTFVADIPARCFENCTSLSSVSLPASVGNIAANAFLNCGSLTSCEIPANATVDPLAFKGCYSFNYTVAAGNPNYIASNGNLYDSTGTRLVRVSPSISSLEPSSILSSCKEIGAGAFSANQLIDKFTVPASVTTIADNAFSGCVIKEITIPGTTTSIGKQANWPALKTIYGESDSAAELWSTLQGTESEGVLFIPIGQSTVPGTTPGTGAGGNGGTTAPTGSTINNTTINNNNVVNGGGSAKTTANGKDATPKTADGDLDPRWFAIFGILLSGVAMIVYSKTRKLEYVIVKDNSDLDS